jgi:transposase
MRKTTRFLGLDVHAETITVAVAEPDGEVRSLGMIPNQPEAVRKLIKKLGAPQSLRACYEAGPCGYGLYWQLTALGVHCDVIAPTLVPVKAGDRVKTDRRDALKLARCYRGGDLTPVWVPDAAHEALRDLVRAREAAKKDQLRARHRLQKYLLRQGRRPPGKMKSWTQQHLAWVHQQRWELTAAQTTFDDYLAEVDHAQARIARLERAISDQAAAAPPHLQAVVAALQTLRGVAELTAVTIALEVGELSRFERPRQLMAYAGLVSGEDSSGERTRRGPITKAGNAHLRRVVVEAAWAYQQRPGLRGRIGRANEGQSAAIRETAWKAQLRLHKRYVQLKAKGKLHQKVITAVARELLGFIWAVGVAAEQAAYAQQPQERAA